MPGKSKHRRGKYSFRSKKGSGKPTPPVIVATKPAVTPTTESAPLAEVSVRSARMSVPSKRTTVVQYPYVLAELRRTGMLAGIILIILIVLALVW